MNNKLLAVNADDKGGGCPEDAAEMQQRCSRDAAEMQRHKFAKTCETSYCRLA